MLFQQFGINYDKLPEMFKKGSCVFRNKVISLKNFQKRIMCFQKIMYSFANYIKYVTIVAKNGHLCNYLQT